MKKTILTIILLTLSAFLITACEQERSTQEELLILTSSFPLYEFAREIAPQEDVRMLVPPGVDIHHYDLRPSDIALLERSDLIIYIGEDMEPWLDNILSQKNYETLQATKHTKLLKAEHGHSHEREYLDDNDENESQLNHLIEEIDYLIHEWEDGDLIADEAIEEIEELIHDFPYKNALLERIDYLIHEWEDGDLTADETMEKIEQALHDYEDHDEDYQDDDEHDSEYDPHVWLDFENSIEIVNAITSKLSAIKPENTEQYRANADEYIKDIRSLDKKYEEELANCEIRHFITGHDSFGYLANKYNLTQIPIRGLSAEQEPSPRVMTTIINEAREHNITHVFFEELASPRISQALANEIGAETLMMTPAENIPAKDFGQKTFIDVMNQNLENLKQGLRCN